MNPFLFLIIVILAGGAYIAATLNLLGPMMQMTTAAFNQGVELGKQKLREFVENSDTARQALSMPAREGTGAGAGAGPRESVRMETLDGQGRKKEEEDVEEI